MNEPEIGKVKQERLAIVMKQIHNTMRGTGFTSFVLVMGWQDNCSVAVAGDSDEAVEMVMRNAPDAIEESYFRMTQTPVELDS